MSRDKINGNLEEHLHLLHPTCSCRAPLGLDKINPVFLNIKYCLELTLETLSYRKERRLINSKLKHPSVRSIVMAHQSTDFVFCGGRTGRLLRNNDGHCTLCKGPELAYKKKYESIRTVEEDLYLKGVSMVHFGPSIDR